MSPPASPAILHVEDNATSRAVVAGVLRQAGYRVDEAATGAEALQQLAEAPPALVILDICLPDADGFELCRRIKADPKTAGVFVLHLSGQRTRIEDRVYGLEGGADAYLVKPVDAHELLATVRTLLRIRASEQALRQVQEELEQRVAQRTAELTAANAALRAEVAARRHAEDDLVRHARVLESMAEGVCSTDEAGTILLTNPAFDAMFGYAKGELLGRHASVLNDGPPTEADELSNRIRRKTLAEGTWSGEMRNRRKDGTTFITFARASVVELAGARHVVVVREDITERLRLERQLRQAHKMEAVGRLAGGVAHDFNNMLTVITGYSKLLVDALPEGDPRRVLAEEVRRAGERSAALTRQLLAFSRQQLLAPVVTDLNRLVEQVGQLLRRLIGEDVALKTRLAPDLWRVKVDPGQVEQVLVNLAVNARDAMPQGGELCLETANATVTAAEAAAHPGMPPGDYVRLSVRDAGCGMDADTLAHVFEPFFTTKPPGAGTGLGLATVYGIVKQSDGFIYVDSAPGRGTTFRVYFPPTAEEATTPAESPAAVPARGHEVILLVEDEEQLRRLARRVLLGAGYTVLEAGHGPAALELAATYAGSIDLLVTDVVMPGMSGGILARRLQEQRPGLKVLFLSGYADDSVVRHGVHEASVNFLAKPFRPDALVDKVRAVLDG